MKKEEKGKEVGRNHENLQLPTSTNCCNSCQNLGAWGAEGSKGLGGG